MKRKGKKLLIALLSLCMVLTMARLGSWAAEGEKGAPQRNRVHPAPPAAPGGGAVQPPVPHEPPAAGPLCVRKGRAAPLLQPPAVGHKSGTRPSSGPSGLRRPGIRLRPGVG